MALYLLPTRTALQVSGLRDILPGNELHPSRVGERGCQLQGGQTRRLSDLSTSFLAASGRLFTSESHFSPESAIDPKSHVPFELGDVRSK